MMCTSSATFIDLGHNACFTAQNNFSVVLEVNLHYLVGESKHDGVFGAHPLLDVHRAIGSR